MRPLAREVFIGVALAMSIVSVSVAQDGNRTTTLSSVLHGRVLLSGAHWSVSGGDLLCIVSKPRSSAGHSATQLSTKMMGLYRENGPRLTLVYEFATPDALLSIYPLGEFDARLVTIWTAGSAYHIRVFAYLSGKVKQVLDAGSKGMPEVVIDENEREAILITHMDMSNGEWKRSSKATTDIYMWDGKTYDKVRSVGWAKRFQDVFGSSTSGDR